jgi:hypothetical protein
MAKSKSHPLDNLSFSAPKLEEVQPVIHAAKTAAPPPVAEEETRASNVTLQVRAWEWIDAKHAQARSNRGKPLRKAAIIRAVFEAVMSVEVDLSGAQSEEDIAKRIIGAMKG